MRATAKAQPNIALIKYWGKRDTLRNLPAVGSISITLADIHTTMCVEFDKALQDDVLTVNSRNSVDMLPRVRRCLDSVAGGRRPLRRRPLRLLRWWWRSMRQRPGNRTRRGWQASPAGLPDQRHDLFTVVTSNSRIQVTTSQLRVCVLPTSGHSKLSSQ